MQDFAKIVKLEKRKWHGISGIFLYVILNRKHLYDDYKLKHEKEPLGDPVIIECFPTFMRNNIPRYVILSAFIFSFGGVALVYNIAEKFLPFTADKSFSSSEKPYDSGGIKSKVVVDGPETNDGSQPQGDRQSHVIISSHDAKQPKGDHVAKTGLAEDSQSVIRDNQHFSKSTPVYIKVYSSHGQNNTEGFYKSVSSTIQINRFTIQTKPSDQTINLDVDVIDNGNTVEDIDAEEGKKISVYKSCPSIEFGAKWDGTDQIVIANNIISLCRSVDAVNDGYNDAAITALNTAVMAIAEEIVSQMRRAVAK